MRSGVLKTDLISAATWRCRRLLIKGIVKEDITYLYMDTYEIEVREFDGCY